VLEPHSGMGFSHQFIAETVGQIYAAFHIAFHLGF
jgi:hypothetical protein